MNRIRPSASLVVSRRTARSPVLDQLVEFLLGAQLEQVLLGPDQLLLRLPLGRRLGVVGSADGDRAGDGGHRHDGRQRVRVEHQRQALGQAGDGEDAVVDVRHPGPDVLLAEPPPGAVGAHPASVAAMLATPWATG